jgi:hypothetical protein
MLNEYCFIVLKSELSQPAANAHLAPCLRSSIPNRW